MSDTPRHGAGSVPVLAPLPPRLWCLWGLSPTDAEVNQFEIAVRKCEGHAFITNVFLSSEVAAQNVTTEMGSSRGGGGGFARGKFFCAGSPLWGLLAKKKTVTLNW